MGANRANITLSRLALAGSLIGATLAGAGCVPLAVTGVAVGAMAATDRRTLGAQTDDQTIELKALTRIQQDLKVSSGVSITSYNRKVLLTGQVADEKIKRDAGALVSRLDSVRSVQNELQVGAEVSMSTSANDSGITTKVKTAFLDAKDLQSNAFKVVTENSVVYLMGIVTRNEGDRAAQLASRTSGVKKVVTVFEYVTDDELARIVRTNQEAPKPAQEAPKQ
jgi:osmotically-inducible protein OsmY